MKTTKLHPTRRRRRPTAFTLAELLIVILIVVVVLLIAVPAFSALLNSSEATMAQSVLRSSLRAGRDLAVRSAARQDAAIVFAYEPGGRLTMIPCVKAGEIVDIQRPAPPGGGFQVLPYVTREIFVPSSLMEPVQLPKGWMVRGYAPRNSIQSGTTGNGEWYEGDRASGDGYGRYANRQPATIGSLGDWVFPETGFYDPAVWHDMNAAPPNTMGQAYRQTFMVRFEGGTGRMMTASPNNVVVLLPRPSRTQWPPPILSGGPGSPTVIEPPNRVTDLASWVNRVINGPMPGTNPGQRSEISRAFLGDESADTVLSRCVSQLALYDEGKLASGIGARVDGRTGCLYAPYDTATPGPRWVPNVSSSRVNRWIEGDTNNDGRPGATDSPAPDAPEARIYVIDRYTAALHEVEVQP